MNGNRSLLTGASATGSAMPVTDVDVAWMRQALTLAAAAARAGEVPVGAVVVRDDEWVSTGRNQPIEKHDASAHAEIVALRAAGATLGNYRLPECTLYATLEPCLMCAGAIIHARIKRLVFGATDPRAGAICSVCNTLEAPWLNHSVAWQGGVLADSCGDMLRTFFRQRR